MYTFRGSTSDLDGDAISSIDFKNASGTVVATTTPTNNNWSQAVPLDPGVNLITVEATDARGATGMATAEITRDLFLNITVSPIYDSVTGTAYVLSSSFNGSAPLAVISVDLATGTRVILSGEGTGAGPVLERTDRMIRNANDGSLIVFNSFPAAALAVDILSGDRTLLTDTTTIGEIRGAVVDAANNRVLLINPGYELWSISLADGSLTMLGTIVVPAGNAGARQGLAISSDGALLYVHAGPVIAEVNTQTLAVREFALDNPPDSTTDHLLDENQNRIIYAHRQTIVSVDRASGVNQVLAQVPDEEGTPAFISLGRSNDELLFIDQFADSLVALDLVAMTFDRLAGSLVGTGPRLENEKTAYDSNTEFLYSSVMTDGAIPQNDTWDLIRVDPATGDRTKIQIDFGVPLVFVNNRGMAVDTGGNVLWLSTDATSGLFRFDPVTGIGEEVVDLGMQFGGGMEFCYDAGSNMGYMFRTVIVSEVIALDIDAGNAFVLSNEALGIGSGPSAAIPSGLACDPINGRLLIGDTLTATASVLAVDTATGNRTIVSDATTGLGDALISPRVVAASPDGSEAFVYDSGNNSLVRVDLTNGDRSEVFGISFGPSSLQVLGMTMIDNESAFVSDQGWSIWVVDLLSGELILVSK